MLSYPRQLVGGVLVRPAGNHGEILPLLHRQVRVGVALGTARPAAITYRTHRTVPPAFGKIPQSIAGQVESPVTLVTEHHSPAGGGQVVRRRGRGVRPSVALLAGFTLGALPRVLLGAFEHLRRHVDTGWMGSPPANRTPNESLRLIQLIFVLRPYTDCT